MRLRTILLPLLMASLAVSPPAAAQEAAEFPALLARFQSGDTTVDVRALRMAYTRTEAYDPYDSTDAEAHGAMWEHLQAGRHAEAARGAEALLASDWLDIAPHMVAAMAYDAQAADSAAKLHAFAVRALVGSIGGPEDGRSPEAPMHVIDVSEEYAWLNYHGLRSERQGVGPCATSRCDSFAVRDEAGKEFHVFFDVGILYAWMQRQMEGAGHANTEARP
jgi:hypothetical protein